MTTVRLTNSNTSVTSPAYIEVWSTKLEDIWEHEVIQFNKPIAPANWLTAGAITAPVNNIFDLKQIKQSYQINGLIDVDSNRDSSWNADPLTEVNQVKDKIKDIAESGGVIRLIIIDENSTETMTGTITNMRFAESPEDQDGGLSSPEQLEFQFTFVKGQNVQT